MTRRLISSGSWFEREIGEPRAVVVGDHVHVSGTTGFDDATRTIAADVVRVRYLLPDAADFPATWPALRAAFGEARPAATRMLAGLADPRMRIEIEVDAIRGVGG